MDIELHHRKVFGAAGAGLHADVTEGNRNAGIARSEVSGVPARTVVPAARIALATQPPPAGLLGLVARRTGSI